MDDAFKDARTHIERESNNFQWKPWGMAHESYESYAIKKRLESHFE